MAELPFRFHLPLHRSWAPQPMDRPNAITWSPAIYPSRPGRPEASSRTGSHETGERKRQGWHRSRRRCCIFFSLFPRGFLRPGRLTCISRRVYRPHCTPSPRLLPLGTSCSLVQKSMTVENRRAPAAEAATHLIELSNITLSRRAVFPLDGTLAALTPPPLSPSPSSPYRAYLHLVMTCQSASGTCRRACQFSPCGIFGLNVV